MDNRITKSRLKQLLSYDLLKICALILAGVILWSLLFTMFGDSLSEGQSLNVYWYNVSVYGEEINGLLEKKSEGDFKSYEVHETTAYNFGAYSPNNTTMPQQFSAWTSVGQIDIFIVSNAMDLETEKQDENGATVKEKSSVADGYLYYFADLNKVVLEAEKYLQKFGYNEALENTDDFSTVKRYFHSRKRKDNFYRHGMIDENQEVDRFEKIRYSAEKMKKWLADETLDIWVTREVEGKEYVLGIDMGKLEKVGANGQTKKSASTLCGYNVANKKEGEIAAEGVMLAIFDNQSHQPDLFFESLSFAVAVIENYSALT